VKKGDDVFTSGLGGQGGIFPAGYYIGQVMSVQKDGSGTGLTALVKPAVDFNSLNEVLILRKSK
jgi:rod shape-determining protein MreC